MSFDVSPVGGSLPAGPPVDRARDPKAGGFAEAVAGAPTPPIPEEVWDEVDAAARLAQELHAGGRSVRFDVHKLDGEVVASLVDGEGRLLRPLLLEDVIDVGRLARKLDREGL